ncbi:unnamed protein product [Nesidiocoris tenuis]|uniref:Uncharacterized protein n=1 Tax=Nesidiocoris tenuis TaxID=355587 RepID=A0A6H5G6N8_9HEMI|nr:unnamed protein product [Nesidiocoris tenuis]
MAQPGTADHRVHCAWNMGGMQPIRDQLWLDMPTGDSNRRLERFDNRIMQSRCWAVDLYL